MFQQDTTANLAERFKQNLSCLMKAQTCSMFAYKISSWRCGQNLHALKLCLMYAAAVVHQGKLFLVGMARCGKDDMRILDSQTHRWSVLSLDITPTAYRRVLLDAYDGQLIQFGGKTGAIVAASRKQ